MGVSEPFTFGIPLIARSATRNWPLIEALLKLTSVQGQTDADFQILTAGHDRPDVPLDEARTQFIEADWPAEAVRVDNLDSGRKKHAIDELVLERGGGLPMFLDADDWGDLDLVKTARAIIGQNFIASAVQVRWPGSSPTIPTRSAAIR